MTAMDELFVDALSDGGYVPEAAMPHGDSTIGGNDTTNASESNGSLIDELGADFDAGIIDAEKKRSPNAVKYEKKVRGLFALGFAATAENKRTVADSAAILLYGPDIAEAAGDLAATNKNAAKIVDFLTDTTDNAALALLTATIPFILQIAMNHEPNAEVEATRKLRIFGREFPLRVNVKLGRLRPFAHEPQELIYKAYNDDAVREAVLRKKMKIPGVTVK